MVALILKTVIEIRQFLDARPQRIFKIVGVWKSVPFLKEGLFEYLNSLVALKESVINKTSLFLLVIHIAKKSKYLLTLK